MNWLSDILKSVYLPKEKKEKLEKRDKIKSQQNYRPSNKEDSKLKTATIKTRFASYGHKPDMEGKSKISKSKYESKDSPIIIPGSRREKKMESGIFQHFDQPDSEVLNRTETKLSNAIRKTQSEIKSRIPVPVSKTLRNEDYKSSNSKVKHISKDSINDIQSNRIQMVQTEVNYTERCQLRTIPKTFHNEKSQCSGTTLKKAPRFIYKSLSKPIHHMDSETPKTIEFFKETPAHINEDREKVSLVFKDEQHKKKFKAHKNYFESLSPKNHKRKTTTKKVVENPNYNLTETKSSKSKNRKDTSVGTNPINEKSSPTTTKKVIETSDYDAVQTKTLIEGSDYEGVQTKTLIEGPDYEGVQTKTIIEGHNYDATHTQTVVEGSNYNQTQIKTQVETPNLDEVTTKTQVETPNYDATQTKIIVEGPNYEKVATKTVIASHNSNETHSKENTQAKTMSQSDIDANYNKTRDRGSVTEDTESSGNEMFEPAQEEELIKLNIHTKKTVTQNQEPKLEKLLTDSLPIECFGPNSIYYIPEEVKNLSVVSYVPMNDIPVMLTSGGFSISQPHNYVLSRLMLRFQPLKNEWQYYGVMPEPIYNHGMVILNMKVYIIGGKNPFQREHGSMTPSDRVYCLDLMENSWTTKCPMAETRAGFGAVTLHGRIYAIGGIGKNGNILDTVESYDPLTDQWTYVKSLPYPCKAMAAVAHKASIFVIGGMTPSPDSEVTSRIIPNVLSYNIDKDEWIIKNSLKEACACATAEIVDNQIWLCNGCKANENKAIDYVEGFATVKLYKDCIDSYETITNLSHSRFSAASATLGSSVFLFGGINTITRNVETQMEVLIGESVKNQFRYSSKDCAENKQVECCPFPFSLTGVRAICVPSLQSRLYDEFQRCVMSYNKN